MRERWERVGEFVRRRRAENPGPMTLDGTNSYVMAAPGASGVVVVDPGPALAEHLAELADAGNELVGAGTVELVLITHHHGDHTGGSAALHQLTGAPVRAALASYCYNGEPLLGGETIYAAGLIINVLATPGHTSDSLCFAVAQAPPESQVSTVPAGGSQQDAAPSTLCIMLTGDTILGSGSTVICYPDGDLRQYLASLDTLRNWGSAHGTAANPVPALPGHGPVLADLSIAAQAYADHRAERIAQVRSAVERLEKGNGRIPSAQDVVESVYPEVPRNLQSAAKMNVEAQLDYLRTGGGAEQ